MQEDDNLNDVEMQNTKTEEKNEFLSNTKSHLYYY